MATAGQVETAASAVALIKAQAQVREDLLNLTRELIVAEIRAFDGWYDSVAITSLAAKLTKLTRTAQRQTALSTDSFATRILAELLDKRPRAIGAISVNNLRGGVPLESVYGRLADQYRWLRATRGEGAPEPEPGQRPLPTLTRDDIIDRVVARAEVQLDDNLALAYRNQWQANMRAAPAAVTGYRRVLHPELVAVGSTTPGPVCGLCAVASHRVYKREELLPLHDVCRCSTAPIVGAAGGDGDPGSVINDLDLGRIYGEAGSTGRADLKKTKIRIVENSETGPRLTFANHDHRTANDAARDDKTPATLAA